MTFLQSPFFRIFLLLILASFLINSHVKASNSTIDNFLHCLPRYLNPSYPIFNALYTRENTPFLSFLQFYIGNRRLNDTSLTSNSLETLEVNYVQAIVVCARVNGLQIMIRSGGRVFQGLSYVSDVPLIIL
ncbi:Berberine bridge enzyme-like 17 [Bienertia sinuspersici]